MNWSQSSHGRGGREGQGRSSLPGALTAPSHGGTRGRRGDQSSGWKNGLCVRERGQHLSVSVLARFYYRHICSLVFLDL